MGKNKNNFLGTILISVGIILILIWGGTLLDYILHPYSLRFVIIPYSKILILLILGVITFTSGLFLLRHKALYIKLYRLLAFYLFFYGIEIIIMGDLFFGYGIEEFNYTRLCFILYWWIGYGILKWTYKNKIPIIKELLKENIQRIVVSTFIMLLAELTYCLPPF